MLRLIVVILLSWMCAEVAAQTVAIPKSTDIVVIRGKSYYLHTVQQGQTLYSICKAYGVDLEEMKVLNNKKDNTLSLYEVLKIPFVEPFIQQDGKYYYHKVTRGETIYSIARLYNVKPKRLLKHNPAYSHNEPLAVGAVVRLPLNEIDESILNKNVVAMRPPEVVQEERKTEPGRGQIILEEQPEAPAEEHAVVKDTLPVPPREINYREERREMPEYISEVVMPANPFVKIALLLPFSAKDYPLYLDSLGGYQSVTISSRSEQFISFYEGILLAVDSLKNQGYKIDLHVFDTERSSEKMYMMAEEINRLHPDLIIGPVYGSVYKTMADNLADKSIPMVYPLSSRSENFGANPNFIQVNSSFGVLASHMTRWLSDQRLEANIINITLAGAEETDTAEKNTFRNQLKQVEGIHFFNWDAAPIPLDSLRTLLLPDRENILVLPTSKEADVSKILPSLSALTDGYRITVLGLPEWQTFTSVDHETYYKVNTKIFTYSYVDYASDEARRLVEKYRKYFYTEPGSLVFKAFDMGLYFIELAAKYRDRSLEALEYYDQTRGFSRFQFGRMMYGAGKENHAFYIVNFGSDYRLKLETPGM